MRCLAAAAAIAAFIAAFCALIPAVNADTIGSLGATARMSVATTGATGDLTLVLRPFPDVPAGGAIVITLDPSMAISGATSCDVVHNDKGLAGSITSRSTSNRRLTWTLAANSAISSSNSVTTVIACRNVVNPRAETDELTISVVASAGGSELGSIAKVPSYQVSYSPLGSAVRTIIPEDPRADVRSDALVITIFPLTNPLVADDRFEVEIPSGFVVSDGDTTKCEVVQSAPVPSETTVDGLTLVITLSAPVVASETVVIRCSNIRNPVRPRPVSETASITTLTATGRVIDKTTTAMFAAITENADPRPRSNVVQSFVVYLKNPLTSAERAGIENIYCSEIGYVCQSAQILWQFRSFDDAATTISVGIVPKSGKTQSSVSTAINAAQINIVARIRSMLDEHRMDVGTPVAMQIPGSCFNSKADQGETDTDCGGVACAQCSQGQRCIAHSDCNTFNCVNKRCREPARPNAASASASLAFGSGVLVAAAIVMTMLGIA